MLRGKAKRSEISRQRNRSTTCIWLFGTFTALWATGMLLKTSPGRPGLWEVLEISLTVSWTCPFLQWIRMGTTLDSFYLAIPYSLSSVISWSMSASLILQRWRCIIWPISLLQAATSLQIWSQSEQWLLLYTIRAMFQDRYANGSTTWAISGLQRFLLSHASFCGSTAAWSVCPSWWMRSQILFTNRVGNSSSPTSSSLKSSSAHCWFYTYTGSSCFKRWTTIWSWAKRWRMSSKI